VTLAEVTGEVSFNGQPTRAEIIFEPEGGEQQAGGRPSTAFADSDGAFRLNYTADRTGAVLGRHRVQVNILRTIAGREPQSFAEAALPIKTARLVREVRDGKNFFYFAITQ
jgi:hypothetical protein